MSVSSCVSMTVVYSPKNEHVNFGDGGVPAARTKKINANSKQLGPRLFARSYFP